MSEIESLTLVLDGTEAAVYAYGVVAGRLTGSQETAAVRAMASHRAQRDRLRARILALGGEPGAAAAAYAPPFPVGDARAAQRLAALVEDRLAGQWAALAASTTSAARSSAALQAQECAVRSVTWSGVAPVWSGAVLPLPLPRWRSVASPPPPLRAPGRRRSSGV